MRKIPFHKPYPWSKEDREIILQNIENKLISGQLTKGAVVEQLEEAIKELYNVKYCIATSNATLGLFFCRKYFEWFVGPLHLPNFTWPSFYYMMASNSFIRFHDINPKTWLMENDYMGGVVMATHTFGSITETPRKFRNKIIYDGAHSLGCKLKDIGDATVFSLAATKIITSCEGGLVITNNKKLAHYLKKYRDLCCRMSEVHAIIGLYTLQFLDEVLKWKRKVFHCYKKTIPGRFQEIPIESNYNTIGFLNTEKLIIPDNIEIKQYYEPIKKMFMNCNYVYSNMVVLPSYYNCNYKKIVYNIKKVNDL